VVGKKKSSRKKKRRSSDRRRPDTSRDRRFVDIAIIAMLLLAGYFAVFGGEYSIFDIWRLEKTEARVAADLVATEATIDSDSRQRNRARSRGHRTRRPRKVRDDQGRRDPVSLP
jgi:hypothetical protein